LAETDALQMNCATETTRRLPRTQHVENWTTTLFHLWCHPVYTTSCHTHTHTRQRSKVS